MARIRTIKPEFFTSEDIVELAPLARLLYIALWCEADKEGRFAWKPKTFKMRYLPGDDCDIDAICDALVKRRLIVLYGDGLAVIPSFKNHQHINPREKEGAYPAPTDAELTRAPRVSDASVTRREEGRKEGKGKEGKEQLPDAGAPDVAIERRKENLEAIEDQLDAALPVVAPSQEHQAGVVFEHWKLVMDSPRSAFDDKRKGFIKKALKLGYSVEDLCAAIDGCRKSPHHMGQNDRGLKYNTIDLIFRSADFIDKFMVIGRSSRVPTPSNRPGAAPSNFHGINGQDYSSNAAAAARTQAQWDISSTDGNLDF